MSKVREEIITLTERLQAHLADDMKDIPSVGMYVAATGNLTMLRNRAVRLADAHERLVEALKDRNLVACNQGDCNLLTIARGDMTKKYHTEACNKARAVLAELGEG